MPSLSSGDENEITKHSAVLYNSTDSLSAFLYSIRCKVVFVCVCVCVCVFVCRECTFFSLFFQFFYVFLSTRWEKFSHTFTKKFACENVPRAKVDYECTNARNFYYRLIAILIFIEIRLTSIKYIHKSYSLMITAFIICKLFQITQTKRTILLQCKKI